MATRKLELRPNSIGPTVTEKCNDCGAEISASQSYINSAMIEHYEKFHAKVRRQE
jgi:hypothetical protein